MMEFYCDDISRFKAVNFFPKQLYNPVLLAGF